MRFGAIAQAWHGSPYVASLALTSAGVLATVSTGDHYEMWQSDDGRESDARRRAARPKTPATTH